MVPPNCGLNLRFWRTFVLTAGFRFFVSHTISIDLRQSYREKDAKSLSHFGMVNLWLCCVKILPVVGTHHLTLSLLAEMNMDKTSQNSKSAMSCEALPSQVTLSHRELNAVDALMIQINILTAQQEQMRTTQMQIIQQQASSRLVKALVMFVVVVLVVCLVFQNADK